MRSAMSTLTDLLDQYFFADAPGSQTRIAIRQAWTRTTNSPWSELYEASLADALADELPHLAAYGGQDTTLPDREAIRLVLDSDLGESGSTLLALDTTTGTFLTELARTLQARRALIINGQNPFTDEYREILLNLFDNAHTRFKASVSANEATFSTAIAGATGHDPLLNNAIASFLDRQFAIELTTLGYARVQPRAASPSASSPADPAPPAERAPMLQADSGADQPPAAPTLPPPPPPMPPIPREVQNQLRVLIATPADVLDDRAILENVVRELNTSFRSRYNIELVLMNPPSAEDAGNQSLVEIADIFLGVLWLHFGQATNETNPAGGAFFAGTERDFSAALKQHSASSAALPRTVIYRSIRPPVDLLRFNVADYAQVQRFFEEQTAQQGDDWVHVYANSDELANDARARLEAWCANYAEELAAALSDYGKQFAARGQIAAALGALQQTVGLYHELEQPSAELDAWLQVGTLQRAAGDNAAAQTAFQSALDLARQTGSTDAAGESWYQLGLIAADNDEWRAAIHSFDQARALYTPDQPLYRTILAAETNAYEFLGDSERATNELVQARDAYRDALALADETDDHPRMSQLWSKLGALAAQTQEWDHAADAYDKALSIGGAALAEPTRRALSDAQAEAHTHLAAQARASGDSAAATASYHQALTSLGQGSDDRLKKATLLGALGALAAERGEWHESTRAYDQALANLDRPEDQAQRNELLDAEANAYFNLGESLQSEQRWDEAGAAYRDSLALSQELDDRAQQGVTLYRLGSCSHAQGRLQEANAYFTQSLTRLDRPESAELRTEVLENQAQVLEEVGDEARDAEQWAQAEVSYVQARGVREQLNQGAKTGNLLTNLGIVLAAQGRGQEAIAYFDRALDHLQGAEDVQARSQVMRFQADTLAKLADTRRGAGDSAQAEAAYRQALDLAQQLDDDSLQAELLAQLGLVAADDERWDDAVNFYDQALAHLPDADAAEARARVERHQLAAFASLGARERAAKQYPQAEMAYRSALTLAQQLDDREQEADLLHTLGVLAIEQENWDEALVNLRRSLGIYNLMPSAPAQPRVIFDIGRAQRGHKRRAMLDAVAQGETAFATGNTADAAQAYTDALAAARDLGEHKVQVTSLIRLGDLARSNADWDNALASYDQALEGLDDPDDLAQRSELYRSQIDALEHRSERARTRRDWMSASADLEQALALAATLDDSNRQGELTFRRGEIAADQSEWQTAIALYSEALEAYDVTDEQRADIERAQADAFRHMGDAERAAQNWVGADAAYSQSLTLYQNLGDRTAQAVLLTALASVASPQERWSDAVEYLGRAHTLALQEPADSAALDAAQIESELAHATQALKREEQASAEARGDTLRASQDWQGADAAYRQAIGFAEELQDRTARAELTAKLGFVASESGALDRALEHYREAAGLSDTPDQTSQRGALIELQAQTLQELGNRAGAAGDWEKALRAYQDSVALLDAPEHTAQRADVVRLEAVTLQNLGDSARSVENWSQALDFYRRSAGLYAALSDPERLKQTQLLQAEALVNLARGARASKQFAAALAQYKQAAALYADANATQALDLLQGERILALTEAGGAAADAAQWSDAETSFQEGLALAQEKGDRFAHADLLYRLGDLEQRRSQWQPALGYYAQALELAAPADMPELRAKLLLAAQSAAHKQADAQRIAGDSDAAERSYDRALEMAQERRDPAEAGQLYFLLGTLAADRAQWERAVTAYDSALAQFDLAGDTEHQRDVKSYQAFALQQLGDTQGKTDAAEKSLHSSLALANEIGDDDRAGQTLYRLGLLAFARGAWQESVDFSDAAAAKLPADTAAETLALAREQAEVSTRALKRKELGQTREHAAQAAANQQWEDAASAYRRAESLAGELNDEVSAAQAHQSLVALYAAEAKSLEANQSWDQAATAYRTSLDLAQQANDADAVQERQTDLLVLRTRESQAAIGAQDWAHARRAAESRVALAQEFQSPLAHADALSALGALLLSRREWEPARDALAQAVPIYTAHEASAPLLQARQDLERAQDALNRRAEQQAAMARGGHATDARAWAEANTAYRQALGLAQSLEDEQGITAASRALVELGHTRAQTLANAQDWDAAAAAYRDAIATADEFAATDAKQARQNDLIALAVAETAAHARADDDAREEQAIRKQLALAQEFNQPQAQADALLALGSWNASHSQFEAARDSFSSATELYTQLARVDSQAQSRRELARVQDILERRAKEGQALTRASQAAAAQQWDTAYASYREALDLEASLEDHAAIRARQQDLLALAATQTVAYRTARDWQHAEQATQTHLQLAQEFNQPAEQTAALVALAGIRADQSNYQSAIDTLSVVATQYQELEASAKVADTHVEIRRLTELLHRQELEQAAQRGSAALAANDYATAETEFGKAHALAEGVGDRAAAGAALYELARIAHQFSPPEQAAEAYSRALDSLDPTAQADMRTRALDAQLALQRQIGDTHAGAEQWDLARGSYSKAVTAANELGKTPELIALNRQLGAAAAHQADYRAALDYYDRALELEPATATSDREEIYRAQADAWQGLGDQAADTQQLDAALDAYQHAAELTDRVDDPPHHAEILYSLGLVQAARADYRAAAQSYSAASDIVAEYELPEQQCEILKELGDAQTAQGELDSARDTYRRALAAAEQTGEPSLRGKVQAALGDIALKQERWQEALSHYAAATQNIAAGAPDANLVPIMEKQGEAYEQLGGVHFGEGSWHQAREAYANALDYDLQAGRTDRDGEVLYRLGLTAAAQSDWADAANYYSSSLASLTGDELAQRDRTLAQLAYALQQEGKRAQAAGEWDAADRAYARAITMAGASLHHDQLTDLWLRRGDVYGAQERWGAALGAFQSAAEYDHRYGADARKDEIETKRAEALIREGHTALDAGDTDLAYSSLQHGLLAAAQLRQPALTGQALEGMGRLSAEQGDWSAALDAYAQAGHQFASVEDTEHWRGVAVREAALLRQVGADFEDQGQEADAEHAYHRALALGQTADHHADDGELYYALARTLAAQQRWDDAALAAAQADALYQPLSSRARAEFQQTQTTIFENAGALAQSNQQWADAEEYFKHAADLHDKLDNRPAAGLAWQHLGEIAVAQENWHKAARYNTEALARLDTPESAQARGQVMALQARILTGIGTEQRQAGDWDGAVETYHSAIVIAREQGDLDTLAQVYGLLGSVHEGRSEWADAVREYKNALDIYQELDRPADQASAWQQVGDVERKTEQYDAAAEAFTNARALYHEAGDAPGEGMVIHRLGLVQGDQGNWDVALTWYDDALAHYNEHGLSSAKPQVYRSVEQAVRGAKKLAAQDAAERGDRSFDAADWGAAESSYRESLDLHRELGDAAQLAQAHAKLGSALEAQGQLDQALTEYKASLAQANTTDSRDLQITALVAIGNVQRARANWHESESEYRQALALDPEHSDPQRAAALYGSLGELREAQDDWEGALGYFHQALALLGPDAQEPRARIERNLARAQHGAHQKTQADTRHALELARENGDLAEQGELLNTLGLMSAEDKKWNEALDYYQEAIRVFEELARQDDEQEIWRTAQGTVLNNIGEAQQNLGAWSDAEVFYNRALHVAREVGDGQSEAALLASLGLTAEHQAELPRALDLDMQALAKFRELGGETPPPELLERIGNLQLELERLDAADNTFHEALAAATAADQPDRMARLLKQMGLLAEGRDETDTALACYDRALSLYVDLNEPNEQKQLLKRQSDLYLASEQWMPAEETARQALALAQAEDDRPLAAELTARLGNLAQRSGDWDSAVTHYNDALALHEPQAARARAGLHTSLGEVHLSRGAPDAARAEYQAALAQAGDDADSRVELWTKLAELEESQNRWAEASSAYGAATEALGAAAPDATRLDLLIRRGDAALQAEDWSAAETAYDAALQLAQRSSNRTFEGWILNKLGLLAQAQHQWGESLQTFQESIETLRETGEAVAEAHVLNNIARLKLETGEGTEADLFAQAALTIAKNFGSAEEQSRALYQRGLVALEAQDLEVAERYFRQAIVADPQNWTAQLQLGNALIAGGQVEPSAQQAEAGLGQNQEWALGAQAQMTVAALFQENTKEFRQQLKRTRALLEADRERAALAVGFVDAVSWLVRALEGDTDAALGGMQEMTLAPGLPARLDAYRFLRGALYALARTPRRLRNKSALVAYFAPPNAPARPRSKRRPASGHDAQSELFADESPDDAPDASAAPHDDDAEAHDGSADD